MYDRFVSQLTLHQRALEENQRRLATLQHDTTPIGLYTEVPAFGVKCLCALLWFSHTSCVFECPQVNTLYDVLILQFGMSVYCRSLLYSHFPQSESSYKVPSGIYLLQMPCGGLSNKRDITAVVAAGPHWTAASIRRTIVSLSQLVDAFIVVLDNSTGSVNPLSFPYSSLSPLPRQLSVRTLVYTPSTPIDTALGLDPAGWPTAAGLSFIRSKCATSTGAAFVRMCRDVYVFVCLYVSVCVSVCLCVSLCLCVFVVYVSLCVCVCVCYCESEYVRHVCVRVCTCEPVTLCSPI